ncbi:Inner membrane protein YebE [Thiorhodovibrio winogradskyi]|uniref:Inner membrane protein YebE n=1 Tax=Thiorhodovibrio winogradskyi TaxID=77007 RepID=A0ABZ0S5E9_9GAMM|nr:tellurite resistance TerB family protein [Thiorhodovibrio winogradskyi]
MANFADLLGSVIQNNLGPSGQQRIGNALQDLQASLGQLSGGGAAGAGMGGVLGSLLGAAGNSLAGASQNPLQAGGLGAVLGSLVGGGGQSVKGALSGGALAMIAGVAYKALMNANQGGGAQAPFSGGNLPLGLLPPQTPAEEQVVEQKTQLIIKGMMNIAKSDGEISGGEIQRILGKAQESGLGSEEQAWMMAEMSKPLNLDAFVAEIPNQEVAAEIYAASLLAVEVDTDEEREYLRQFADKTELQPSVVQMIHQTLGMPAV